MLLLLLFLLLQLKYYYHCCCYCCCCCTSGLKQLSANCRCNSANLTTTTTTTTILSNNNNNDIYQISPGLGQAVHCCCCCCCCFHSQLPVAYVPHGSTITTIIKTKIITTNFANNW